MSLEQGEGSTPSRPGAWIAIPAFNEERTIRAVAVAALAVCPRVVIVDDGSSDATVAALHGLPITLLTHASNRGKAASIRTAFAHALGHDAACVVTLDGDGQHDPRDAARLLAAWQRHSERIVIGSRLHDRSRFPPIRYFGNRFACFWISWAAGHPIADSQSGFRVYSRAVMAIATSGRSRCGRFAFESEILIEAADQGHATLAVAIPGHYPRDARPSHFRSVVDTARIVAMVAARLLKKRMHPQGLWRSLQRAPVLAMPDEAATEGARRQPSPRHLQASTTPAASRPDPHP